MIKHAFSFAKSRLLIFQIAFYSILNEVEIFVNIFFSSIFCVSFSLIDDLNDFDANDLNTDFRLTN